MCTQNAPADVTVCDVALPDVVAALDGLPRLVLEHLEGEGTRVSTSDPTAVDAFRARLGGAIARHGGALPTAHP